MVHIKVTQPHIPRRKTIYKYLDEAFDAKYLSNFGPLYHRLNEKLCEHFKVENLLLVCNATHGLELSYRLLSDPGAYALTSPYSFRATATALDIAQQKLIFHDINADTLNWTPPINVIEKANLLAPIHIYGIPSSVINFDGKLRVPTVYDGAHTFNSWVGDRHLISYGDASVISFHPTKLFHCGEGGAIHFKDRAAFLEAKDRINFGLKSSGPVPATNSKISELNCALGLAVFEELDLILDQRKLVKFKYDNYFKKNKYPDLFEVIETEDHLSYYPIIFFLREHAAAFVSYMYNHGIECRPYFNTSLNTIYSQQTCAVSERVSGCIICLPFHSNLSSIDVGRVIERTDRFFATIFQSKSVDNIN